jgi:hypothetical protein
MNFSRPTAAAVAAVAGADIGLRFIEEFCRRGNIKIAGKPLLKPWFGARPPQAVEEGPGVGRHKLSVDALGSTERDRAPAYLRRSNGAHYRTSVRCTRL